MGVHDLYVTTRYCKETSVPDIIRDLYCLEESRKHQILNERLNNTFFYSVTCTDGKCEMFKTKV